MSKKIESEPVGELKLSENSTVKVTKFMGNDGRLRVDIRVWLATQKYSGPTKKGVTVTVFRQNIGAYTLA
ncbi:MAG: hypothetical protein HYZ12_04720 [Thaumarchaeota archaeon]|nr:hypothetical protein [Nitrososphaerota archaeon]